MATLENFYKIIQDEESAYKFLVSKGTLSNVPPHCSTCNKSMIKHRYGSKWNWRCSSHKNTTVSVRKGSFWGRSKLSFRDLLAITFCWAHNFNVTTTSKLTKVGTKTCIQWFKYLRDVGAQNKFQRNQRSKIKDKDPFEMILEDISSYSIVQQN